MTTGTPTPDEVAFAKHAAIIESAEGAIKRIDSTFDRLIIYNVIEMAKRLPLIERDVIERCAKVADKHAERPSIGPFGDGWIEASSQIADRIRKLSPDATP